MRAGGGEQGTTSIDQRQLTAIVDRERQQLPQEAFDVQSMLSYEERALLQWCTRVGLGAEGATVDAGCFLGGSTLPLSFGLLRRGVPGPVHSYDLFRIDGEYARHWFPDDYPFEVGGSILELFERNIEPVREIVQVHAGDIRQERWPAEPIATLFIDITKSWSTCDHVMREFFPALVTDAIVVQQDQVHWGHPWCAMTMELLAEYVEYLGFVFFSSAVYRVVRPIPRDALPAPLLQTMTADRAVDLIDRFAARVGEPFAGHVRLSAAVALATFGGYDEARARVADVARGYSDETVPYISQGLDEMPSWIDRLEQGLASPR